MAMPDPASVTTVDQLLALPEDGLRHELLDGAHVVTPAPTRQHQRLLRELFVALRKVIPGDARIEVLWSPADLRLGPRTLIQPDLFVVQLPVDREHDNWADTLVPLLAIEVLSPSTAARDRGVKRTLYLDAGVEEYWIVDIEARLVERWQQGDERPAMITREFDFEIDHYRGRLDVRALFRSPQTIASVVSCAGRVRRW